MLRHASRYGLLLTLGLAACVADVGSGGPGASGKSAGNAARLDAIEAEYALAAREKFLAHVESGELYCITEEQGYDERKTMYMFTARKGGFRRIVNGLADARVYALERRVANQYVADQYSSTDWEPLATGGFEMVNEVDDRRYCDNLGDDLLDVIDAECKPLLDQLEEAAREGEAAAIEVRDQLIEEYGREFVETCAARWLGINENLGSQLVHQWRRLERALCIGWRDPGRHAVFASRAAIAQGGEPRPQFDVSLDQDYFTDEVSADITHRLPGSAADLEKYDYSVFQRREIWIDCAWKE